MLLYLAVNIWILYRLSCLKEYADIIAISFPEGSITESAFDQWRENADSKAYVQADQRSDRRIPGAARRYPVTG